MENLIVIVLLGAALAGFVQGLSGSNFGLVAMAVWAWLLDPTLTGPLIVCGSLTGQLLAIRSLFHSFNRQLLLPMLAGGLLGVPLGVALLHLLDPTLFRLGVGVLLLVWCPLMLLSRELPRVAWGGRGANAGVGVVGGVMGGLGGLTGPAPVLWAALKGWDRDTQRSVIQGFNLSMHLLTMAVYLVSGTITTEALSLFPLVIVAVLGPTLIGLRLYRRVSDQGFRRVLLSLLSLSGLILVVLSLARLL
jgi:uncharacterized membrane protein YfcA